MRKAITSLFVIYLTFIIAITESKADMRFPADSSIVRGVLNQTDYEFIIYYKSGDMKVVNYTVTVDDGTCGNYQLQLDDDSIFDKFHIIPLKSHTILLLPLHSSHSFSGAALSIEILDTLTCQKNKVVLSSKNKLKDFRITKYDDGFDIYFKDSSLCGRGICRESFDFQGNPIKTSFVKFESDADDAGIPVVMPIGTKLRSNNHLALTFQDEKMMIHVVKNNKLNLVKEIVPESENGPNDSEFLTPQVSMSHNVISIASRYEYESLNVVQLDFKGNVKFETIVNFGYYIRTAKVLNAPDGGAYIVASQCVRDHCDDNDNVYSIRKINANGKEAGSLNVTLPLPGIVEDVSFYEEDESFCLSRAQLSLGASLEWYFKRVDVHVKCFTGKDFK